jgi:NTP pyrophosphatase (non-canonical NTP hydrolase)
MTINEAQQQVDGWIKTVGVRYFSELTNMTILTEEVGELARHMSRQYGDQSYRSDGSKPSAPGGEVARGLLADEMADVLWVLICLANQTGVNLTDAFQKDADRHQQNEKLK